MSTCKCHLSQCDRIVTLRGDGSAPCESVKGTKVFFCSEEHRQEFVRDGQAVRPESFAGYGPGVFSRAGTGT